MNRRAIETQTKAKNGRDRWPTGYSKRWTCSWWLGCMLVGASGCAQVSPLRSLAWNRNAPRAAAQQMGSQLAPAATPPANAPLAPSAQFAQAASRPAPVAPAVAPVAYEQSLSCPSDAPCVDPSAANLVGAGGVCPPLAPIVAGDGSPYWNVQEYLYDGGDREPAVQVTEDWEVRGLNSQDTIAHYETIDGKLCVTATNRVPIYAPRFGAIRKVAAPVLAARAVGAERVLEPTGPVVQKSRDLAGDVTLPTGPKKQANVKLIDGLRDRTRGVGTEGVMPLVNLSNPQVVFQHLEGLGTAVQYEDLEARLAESMLNARTWINDESIAIMMGEVQAVQVRDAKQPQDVTVYETEPGKCTLRICKAASHSAASPGDIISFSIRFDNIGDKPIGNLVILDSLTTRLEYIDGSQQCILSLAKQGEADAETAAVRFSTSENEAGSTVLRWEADLPLASGDSGVISFRCRVR